MKTQMSSLDIQASMLEAKPLVRGRVVKVLAAKSAISLAVHIPEKGKVWMTFVIPGFFYVAAGKPDVGTASPFQSALKKHVDGSRVEAISQYGFERAVRVEFSSKGSKIELVAELFSPGNAVLVVDGKIIISLKKPDEKTKRLAKGQPYQAPPARPQGWDVDSAQLSGIVASSPKEECQAVLAKQGLGSFWAREVCIRASLDPQGCIPPDRCERVASVVRSLAATAPDPRVIRENGLIIDVIPFPLEQFKGRDSERSSMGEGIAALIKQSKVKRLDVEPRMEKVQVILDKQREHLDGLEAEVKENARKGELIFEKYQVVSEVLEGIKKARSRLSWKEIKARLKDHAVIKDIDEATGEITVEL